MSRGKSKNKEEEWISRKKSKLNRRKKESRIHKKIAK